MDHIVVKTLEKLIRQSRREQRDLPKFHGSNDEDVISFFKEVSKIATFNYWTDQDTLKEIPFSFEDRASYFYHTLDDDVKSDLDKLKEAFKEEFDTPMKRFLQRRKLYRLKQNDTLNNYIDDFETLSTNLKMTEETLLYLFIDGLHPYIKESVLLSQPKTLMDAKRRSREIETITHILKEDFNKDTNDILLEPYLIEEQSFYYPYHYQPTPSIFQHDHHIRFRDEISFNRISHFRNHPNHHISTRQTMTKSRQRKSNFRKYRTKKSYPYKENESSSYKDNPSHRPSQLTHPPRTTTKNKKKTVTFHQYIDDLQTIDSKKDAKLPNTTKFTQNIKKKPDPVADQANNVIDISKLIQDIKAPDVLPTEAVPDEINDQITSISDAPDPSKPTSDVADPSKQTFDVADPSKPTFDVAEPSKQTLDVADPSKPTLDVADPSRPTLDVADPFKPTFDVANQTKPIMKNPNPLSEKLMLKFISFFSVILLLRCDLQRTKTKRIIPTKDNDSIQGRQDFCINLSLKTKLIIKYTYQELEVTI